MPRSTEAGPERGSATGVGLPGSRGAPPDELHAVRMVSRLVLEKRYCMTGCSGGYDTRRVLRFMKSMRMNCPSVMVLVK